MKPDPDALPPMDISDEECALGAMMLCGDERETFFRARRLLWPGAFTLAEHQTIFRILCKMDDDGVPIDSVTFRARLKSIAGGEKETLLEEIGGITQIAKLLNSVPSYHNAPNYAAIVAKMAQGRTAIDVASKLVQDLKSPHADASEVIRGSIEKLWAEANRGRDIGIWSIGDATVKFVEDRMNGTKSPAMLTGINSIDRDYSGVFTFGGYTLVAARPSMGKSTFIRWLLASLARQGMPCGLVAVEENRDKIAGNVISNIAGIENAKLAYGKLSHLETDAVADAVSSTARMPLWGVDTALSVPDVMSAMEMLVMEHGCKVIAIDHIHLLGTGRRENRNDELRDISAAMKSAFKRLEVVGIVAAQLSRPPDKGREPPPPHLSDLRESGSLEEHADAALMLHRRDYYHRGERGYSPDHLCQAFVRKNRNGAVGEIVLRAELEYQRFVDESTADPWSEAA